MKFTKLRNLALLFLPRIFKSNLCFLLYIFNFFIFTVCLLYFLSASLVSLTLRRRYTVVNGAVAQRNNRIYVVCTMDVLSNDENIRKCILVRLSAQDVSQPPAFLPPFFIFLFPATSPPYMDVWRVAYLHTILGLSAQCRRR